jgi:hypothetical protein
METLTQRVRQSISQAVSMLGRTQLEHGEFPVFRYRDATLTSPGQQDSSPFATTFVLYALSFVAGLDVAPAVAKGVGFLLKEREGAGVWRYWTSRNTSKILPDLDDTCCASFILDWLIPSLIPPTNHRVILDNQTPEGFFLTWLRNDGFNEIDSAVNANVLLYLGDREQTRATSQALARLINDGLEGTTHWLYYLDLLALYYMVSRAYRHRDLGLDACRNAVLQRTLARQRSDGSFGSDLLTGLALCTLLNYGYNGESVYQAAQYLVSAQHEDGYWRSEAFYFTGPNAPPHQHSWWGSEALTTAFCLEGLAKALTLFNALSLPPRASI